MGTTNLHDAFRAPTSGVADTLARFLEDVDQLAGIRAIHAAMRRALDIRPGMHVLDAGCGIGLEAGRLAALHPRAHVTGLDRSADLLRTAEMRRDGERANLRWHHADLVGLDLPAARFDAIRTERVLMYLPDPDFERVVDALIGLLRPAGRLVLVELDYGATILPEAGHGADMVRRGHAILERSLPQPWAGRRLPGLLADRDLAEVDATPFSFAPSEPVWRRIVRDTLYAQTDADDHGELSAWLDDQRDDRLLAVFTGILTTARVAG